MHDPRIGTVIDGHRIEERLGEGGMGVVYRARHLILNRDVALKLIRPELSHDQAFQRFRSEMEIAAAIDDEHVVRVHGAADTDDGGVYLTMQLVDGERAGHGLAPLTMRHPSRSTGPRSTRALTSTRSVASSSEC